MSEGRLLCVCKLSGRCLEGVCKVSVRCLECVWKVSGMCLECVSGRCLVVKRSLYLFQRLVDISRAFQGSFIGCFKEVSRVF